ncbi:30S ribosomal protein THX [Chryseobacterium gossypii]|uniref:30S ribosomal protein THX n=1 Tax=Chryseobacterium gossypii TaxID=3231602 RepID=UPI003524D60B
MGKGDKKTRRGKINSGSYGKTRPRKASKSSVMVADKEEAEEQPKAKKAKKTEK